MKLTEAKLKQIIKEELETSLNEMIDDEIDHSLLDDLMGDPLSPEEKKQADEIDHSPLDDLMGDPLSPEEKKQADERYQKSLATDKIVDIVFNLMDKGMTKNEVIQALKSELNKH